MREPTAYGLALFAVAAGYLIKIGRKIEAGKAVTGRDWGVLATILPAFGALGGAAAVHFGSPVWLILLAGICAGWMGIGTMKLLLKLLPYVLPAPLARLLEVRENDNG